MPSLKGTKTEANLMAAFAGESQARNKYTYYASKEGWAYSYWQRGTRGLSGMCTPSKLF